MKSRWRLTLPVALTIMCVVLQTSVFARIALPGASPDLVAAAVIAAGLLRGTAAGALTGAGAGLLLDLVPPAGGPFGTWTLVLAVVGTCAGTLAAREPTKLTMLGAAILLTSAAVLGGAIASAVAGSQSLVGQAVPAAVLWAGLYAAVLAPGVIPATARVASWVASERA